MPTLTGAQVYKYARDAGFSTRDAVIATQISCAESGWNTDAVNPSSQAAGLMQIHPSHATEYPVLWPNRLQPDANMKLAYYVYKRQGWRAWTTYTSGAYKQVKVASNPMTQEVTFTPPNGKTTTALPTGDAPKDAGTISNPLSGLAALPSTLNKIASNFLGGWLGISLIIIGVFILLRRPIMHTAKNGAKATALGVLA